MTTFIVLTLIGAVIAMGVGAFWYSPATPMGKLHMRNLGFDKLTPEEQAKKIAEAGPTMWKTYLGQMILSLMLSASVVFIVSASMQNGVGMWMALIFPMVNWLCFTVPAVGQGILWGNCEPAIVWKKFFSDIGCILVTVLGIGLLTAFFA